MTIKRTITALILGFGVVGLIPPPAAQSQQPGAGRKMMVAPLGGPASPNAGFTGQQNQQKVPAVQKGRWLGPGLSRDNTTQPNKLTTGKAPPRDLIPKANLHIRKYTPPD